MPLLMTLTHDMFFIYAQVVDMQMEADVFIWTFSTDWTVSRSSTADGIRLMRGIGFTEIPSITRRKNFLIEVEKSGIKEIMQYKQALRESGVASAFSNDVPLLPRARRKDVTKTPQT